MSVRELLPPMLRGKGGGASSLGEIRCCCAEICYAVGDTFCDGETCCAMFVVPAGWSLRWFVPMTIRRSWSAVSGRGVCVLHGGLGMCGKWRCSLGRGVGMEGFWWMGGCAPRRQSIGHSFGFLFQRSFMLFSPDAVLSSRLFRSSIAPLSVRRLVISCVGSNSCLVPSIPVITLLFHTCTNLPFSPRSLSEYSPS